MLGRHRRHFWVPPAVVGVKVPGAYDDFVTGTAVVGAAVGTLLFGSRHSALAAVPRRCDVASGHVQLAMRHA